MCVSLPFAEVGGALARRSWCLSPQRRPASCGLPAVPRLRRSWRCRAWSKNVAPWAPPRPLPSVVAWSRLGSNTPGCDVRCNHLGGGDRHQVRRTIAPLTSAKGRETHTHNLRGGSIVNAADLPRRRRCATVLSFRHPLDFTRPRRCLDVSTGERLRGNGRRGRDCSRA